MEWYVRTRGTPRPNDYRWFPTHPPARWWTRYEQDAVLEHPTLLLERDQLGWRAYLSGIPSARRDSVGTPLRYTMELQSGPGPMSAAATGVVVAWLQDRQKIGDEFDQLWPADVVDNWYSGTGPLEREFAGSLDQRMQGLIRLPSTPLARHVSTRIGGLLAPGGMEAGVEMVQSLASGQTLGRLLILNAADVSKDGHSLARRYQQAGEVMLLLDMSAAPIWVIEWNDPAGETPKGGDVSGKLLRIILTITAAVLGLAFLVAFLRALTTSRG